MVSPSKVVLDTNVIISALIHSGSAREFIFWLVSKNIEIVLSDYILSEVEEVLKRNKFKDKEILENLWSLIKRDAEIVKVTFKVSKTPLRDPKDHPILKTAQKGKADFIITGDKDLLTLVVWRGIKIVKMAEFGKMLNKEFSSALS